MIILEHKAEADIGDRALFLVDYGWERKSTSEGSEVV